MVDVSEIGWGQYRQFEGPFYRGRHYFVIPHAADLTEEDKILAVVTATEGGHYDAINMYDGPPILSSGLIQFIEGKGQRSVSQMIGETLRNSDVPADDFNDFLNNRDCALVGYGKKWFLHYGTERVDTTVEQNELFRCGSDGTKGSWSDEARAFAKAWAAAVASFWEDPRAQYAQVHFIIPQLKKFAFGDSRKWITLAEQHGGRVAGAFVAAYLSSAVNSPTRADKHLNIALSRLAKKAPWTDTWLIEVLKELTFGPKISIYPHRYNAIRPVIEKLYGIDLPDFAKELEQWKSETGHESFYDVVDVQEALITFGYDLGPHGADGAYGKKTRDAVFTFEQLHGVKEPDGMMDSETAKLLEKELYLRGKEQLE